jgi:aspartate/methionine/tyrosine aminotransferase
MLPIDLTLGDALGVRRRAVEHLHCPSILGVTFDRDMSYDDSRGLSSLVGLIEDANPGYRAVITCGAMQGLNVVVRAMKEFGHDTAELCLPYWGPITEILNSHGVSWNATPDFGVSFSNHSPRSFYLLVSPNNPDGSVPSTDEMQRLEDLGIPIVHDGAYCHPHYYNEGESVELRGPIIIHSLSKMLGMSGLRVGFVLCKDRSIADRLRQIVDVTSSGTSALSQRYAAGMLETYWRDDECRANFEQAVRKDLKEARADVEDAIQRFLTGPIANYRGMFGWYPMDPAALNACKILHYSGDSFGAPGNIRLNLAAGVDKIRFACQRLRAL